MFLHPTFSRDREPTAPRGRTASGLGLGLGSRRQQQLQRHSMALALALLSIGVCFCLVGLLSSSVPAPAAPPSASASPALRGLVSVRQQHQPQPRYEAQAFKLGDLGEASSSRRRTRIVEEASSGDVAAAATAAAAAAASSTANNGTGGPWWRRNLARAVLLVVASSHRPAYLQKCLDAVLAHYPGPPALLPIVISEDGASDGVRQVVDGFRQAFGAAYGGGAAAGIVTHLHHPQRRQQQQQQQQQAGPTTWRQWLLHGPAPEGERGEDDGYHRLSRHFGWALEQAFLAHAEPRTAADTVIVLEEDLEVSPDFFAYFGALAPALLDAATEGNASSAHQLMAISAWNDNGMGDRLDPLASSSSSHPRSRAVHRSDFFPGLGWMLARPVWEELQPKWPAVYWDDWLRQPAQRRGRHFLRPAVSRTHHFGRNGTSHGQFSALLDANRLSDAPAAAWANEGAVDREVAMVVDEGAYDRALAARIEAAEEMEWAALKLHLLLPPPPSRQRRPGGGGGGAGIRVVYDEPSEAGEGAQDNDHHVAAALPPSFSRIARGLGIFQDLKSGVPRTGYKGVVATYLPPPLDAHVYLVPSDWWVRLSSPSSSSSVGSMDGDEARSRRSPRPRRRRRCR